MLMKFALGAGGTLGPGVLLEVALGFAEPLLERLAPFGILDDARLDVIETDALDSGRGAIEIARFLAI